MKNSTHFLVKNSLQNSEEDVPWNILFKYTIMSFSEFISPYLFELFFANGLFAYRLLLPMSRINNKL